MTKICDACATGAVHKDVWLAGDQYNNGTKFIVITHPLDVPVDHIVGMQVGEAFGDIR